MAKSKLVKANQKIAESVVSGYHKIEEGVVSGFTRITDKFVDEFLTKEGESVEDAKRRLAAEQAKRQASRQPIHQPIKWRPSAQSRRGAVFLRALKLTGVPSV